MAERTFIAYARADGAFAVRVADDLRQAGVRVWIDQFDIGPGERWDVAVERALTSSDTVLLILSPDAVASEAVMDELSFALDEKKRVIPVLCRPTAIPLRIRRLQRIDATTNYDIGIHRLVEVLKVTGHVIGSREATSDKDLSNSQSGMGLPTPPVPEILGGVPAAPELEMPLVVPQGPAPLPVDTHSPSPPATSSATPGRPPVIALVWGIAGTAVGVTLLMMRRYVLSQSAAIDSTAIILALFWPGLLSAITGFIVSRLTDRRWRYALVLPLATTILLVWLLGVPDGSVTALCVGPIALVLVMLYIVQHPKAS